MKKAIMLLMVCLFVLLSVASVSAWNWQEARGEIVKAKIQNVQTFTSNDLLEADKVLSVVNSNELALSYIDRADIDCLNVKTESRKISLVFDGDQVIEDSGRCKYQIKTKESDLNALWEKYNSGKDITVKELRQRFKIPINLYWKIVLNLWE